MPSYDFSYEYDGAGNRTKKIDNLTSDVTTYVYDSANQLISMEGPDGTTTFDWDAAGNMIAKHAPEGTTTYTWDYRNRLTQIAPPVGDPINFAYNAMGQRIQKNGTRFIYDGVQMLQETDLNNQTLRSNTFTNEGYGDLVSENNGTDSSFPTFNGQSSTDAIVNKTATVTDRLSYSAFGGQDSHTGSSTTPFRFVGKQSYYNDAETGLYLLGAGGNPNGAGRYYDPAIGRFISRDPLGLAGGDVNLYRYAGNNPISAIDPSGAICMVGVHCSWATIVPGAGRHCGLTVRTNQTGDARFTSIVLDGSSKWNRGRLIISSEEREWEIGGLTGDNEIRGMKLYDDRVCRCILRYRADFGDFKYSFNGTDGGANSNWALNCMISECKVDYDWSVWGSGKPFLYDYPPCKTWILVNKVYSQWPTMEGICNYQKYECDVFHACPLPSVNMPLASYVID